MKRLSLLAITLLMCTLASAQQALWGGAPVVSPEIHDNNTVTFRLKAPKALRWVLMAFLILLSRFMMPLSKEKVRMVIV